MGMSRSCSAVRRTESWWRGAVAYQVYVPSFQDSDGDGVGDLDGLRSRLDDLAWLGVDVLWLSPIVESPMRDHGYDVTDYCRINDRLGNLDSFDKMLTAAHERGLRVLLDWVPNHTSTDHPWFRESAASIDNAKRDWYVWVDQPGEVPPNNWQSVFPAVGSAWTRHPATGQWYLHSFLREQADLNWDNPEVVAAAHDVMRFWLDRGIDGFRIDVVHNLGKHPALVDNPRVTVRPSPETAGRRNDEDYWPNLWPKIEGIRMVLEEYPGTIAVGESYVLNPERVAAYTRPGRLHLAHDFTLTELDWEARSVVATIRRANAALGERGWPAWILSSHDHGRLATRWDEDGRLSDTGTLDIDRAEAALALLLLMRGTPFVFQGEELALADLDKLEDFDIDGRARSRAPLPWEPDRTALGFTTGEAWMPSPHDHSRSRQTQHGDPESTLHFIRSVIALRKGTPALRTGGQTISADGDVISLTRTGDSLVKVHLNTKTTPVRVPGTTSALMLRRATLADDTLTLGPNGIAVTRTT